MRPQNIGEQASIQEQLEDLTEISYCDPATGQRGTFQFPQQLLYPTSQGKKGDLVYANSGDILVEFFSKAGNFSPKRTSYHGELIPMLDIFRAAWDVDRYRSMQLAMYIRDCRGGTGNRSGFRDLIEWIGIAHPEWMIANLHLVTEHGRWDDLMALCGTACEDKAMSRWTQAILKGDGLACKWTPRPNKKNKSIFHRLRRESGMSLPEFRQHLAKHTKVVETQMCDQSWNGINYNHVPSVAMARLTNAFDVHDHSRFDAWKESLSDPESGNKINASVLFPHDCIRTMRAELGNQFNAGHYHWSYDRTPANENYADSLVANAQFNALPNFMEENDMRIMPICDFSGSMCDTISQRNTIQLIDVCMGLGLYCSDRVGEDNPFYRKFIPFSDNARIVDWKDETFSVAVQKYNDGFCGSTNIRAALDQILNSGIMFGATNEQMPNCLLIISDMQWDCNVKGNGTAVENGMQAWEAKGYNRPMIVYWNLNKYDGQPATVNHTDVALVSGYSPAVLRAICGGEDFTPQGIMERAIAKYEVVRPE